MTDGKKAKIINLLKEVQPNSPRQKDATKTSLSIVGNGNIQAYRDVNISPRVVHKTVVKTGDGTIDASQKAEIQRLISEWIETRNAVRKHPMSYAAAWRSFNAAFDLNSYHELPMERFGEGRAWLMRQLGIISNMPSAPKRMPGWRTRTIGAIKAACRNDLDDPDAYRLYTEKNFGCTSLTKLTDDDLQATKQYIVSRKRTVKRKSL